ncbi:MAG: hypothetical protein ACPHEP_01930 [Acidimicrobiales bacterium]|jgi:hypothetical protein
MDEIDVVQFVQRSIKERKGLVLDLLENNGIKSMEQYNLCMGELNALNFVSQELSGLLEKQELQND